VFTQFKSSAWLFRYIAGHDHGVLHFQLSDIAAFRPYIPFIENLGHMLAVVFEERRHRSLHETLLATLEQRVINRTRALEHEIAERKQAEAALKKSEENLRITLNSIGDAVISTDTAGTVVRMNKVAEQLTGWRQEDAIGQPLPIIFRIFQGQTNVPAENPAQKVMRAGKIVELANHTVLRAKAGEQYHIADSGAPIRDDRGNIIGVVLVFRDVSEQLRTEQELLKVKKLESLGLLAGGIAHDFNNLLTGVFGNVELAKMNMVDNEQPRPFLERAMRSLDDAINLATQLLTFAKGGDPIKETLDIGPVITNAATFSIRGSNVRLRLDVAPELWPVEADKGQLGQVMSNLVINAQQAMPTGGEVTLSAANVETRAGRYVKITVRDEGSGIAPQDIDRVFDPYFTTKHTGSGLGLATAHSIVNKHDGRLTVASELNQGATFIIHLPVASEDLTGMDQPSTAHARLWPSPLNVLVLDDEEGVRAVLGAMLETLGHVPAFAETGQEAVEKYRVAHQNDAAFDVVITDLIIPGGMGGRETAQEILELNPQAALIVSSGYATDPVMANYRQYGFKSVVVKPYRLADLQKALEQAVG
jgi:two-component system cell cycle sensor histidine kinase/response regulator CckA